MQLEIWALRTIVSCFLVHGFIITASASRKMPPVRVRAKAPERVTSSPAENILIKNVQEQDSPFTEMLLAHQKSIQISDYGAPGASSNVTMRGMKSSQTAVFMDGMDISNPARYGGYTLTDILKDNLESIQIASSTQSGNFSHAAGGAINLEPFKARESSFITGNYEHSTYPSSMFNVQTGGHDTRADCFISITSFNSGKGEKTTHHGNTVADSYQLKNLAVHTGLKATPRFEIRVLANSSVSSLKENDSWDTLPRTTNHFNNTQDQIFKVSGIYKTSSGIKQSFFMGHTHHESVRTGFSSFLEQDGKSYIQSYRIKGLIREGMEWMFSAENRIESYQASSFPQSHKNQSRFFNSAFKWYSQEKWHFFLSGRAHYLAYGKQRYTYQLGTRYQFTPQATGKINLGTGLRAPQMQEVYGSLYQQANEALQPERSQHFEIGLEARSLSNKIFLDVTLFQTRLTDAIVGTPVSPTQFKSLNEDSRCINGLELFTTFKPSKRFEVTGIYAYLEASDSYFHGFPPRLARHKFNIDAMLHLNSRLNFYSGISYKGRQRDYAYGTRMPLTLPEHVTVHAGGSYKLAPSMNIFARVDNMLNRANENAYGYGGTGRTLTFGCKGIF